MKNLSLSWLAWAISAAWTIFLMSLSSLAVIIWYHKQDKLLQHNELYSVLDQDVVFGTGSTSSTVELYSSVSAREGKVLSARAALRLQYGAGMFVTPAVVFGVYGFIMALVFYFGSDYPCFLWIVDSETRCGGKA